jgi:hypothetical protein
MCILKNNNWGLNDNKNFHLKKWKVNNVKESIKCENLYV